MKEFVSLNAAGLTDDAGAQVFGEEPIVNVEEGDGAITLSYTFPGFTMSDDDRSVDGEDLPFREIGVSGSGFLSESGKPLLPSFGRFVQIPRGCAFEYSVAKSRPINFEDVLVTPAQEEAMDGEDDEERFEFDAGAYKARSYYPKDMVAVTGPFELDGYQVLSVHVRPLRYNAKRKRLQGYGNVTVSIALTPKDVADTPEDMGGEYTISPSLSGEAFGNLLLNPKRNILARFPEFEPKPIFWPCFPRYSELLVIYNDPLEGPVQDLAQWKRKRGLTVETVPISTVGNSVGQIKTYIRNRRKVLFSRLRYVLLFGDVDAITAEEASATTDYYYYTKDDPASSSDCKLPWVSGGRIPVQNLAEAEQVVDQIIRYEKSPPTDSDYYDRMTFAAYFQDDPPQDGKANRAYVKTMEGIREHLVSLGFDIPRVYVSNNPNPEKYKDGTDLPLEVRDAFIDGATATTLLIDDASDGRLFFGHRDHGGRTGWSHPSFRSSHLPLISGSIPSIFYSINCQTGRFDANPYDCFAEDIMALNGAAPSLIAATENSGTWRNDSLMKGLFDALWPGVLPTFPGSTAAYAIRNNRLGDILNYAKAYLLVAHGTTSGVKSHFEMYHVVGDPTLELWAQEPLPLRLHAWICQSKLLIRTSSCPSGAVLTLWFGDRLLKRIVPRGHFVTVPLADMKLVGRTIPSIIPRRQALTVCYSAPGHRFAQTRVPFRPFRIVRVARPWDLERVEQRATPQVRVEKKLEDEEPALVS